jgi:hypothetical protein
MEPPHTNPISDTNSPSIHACFDDPTDDLVTENCRELQRRCSRPVSLDDVQIGMANAASLYLEKHLIGFSYGTGCLFDFERLSELVQHSCFHERSNGIRALTLHSDETLSDSDAPC